MTNPFTDDAIDDALKACDVLTDAWDRLVRHQVFDHCRDQPGMPDKMLARLDNLAKAETERDRIAATLRRTKKERDQLQARIDIIEGLADDHGYWGDPLVAKSLRRALAGEQ